jgi:hypothetical protein
MARAGLHWKQSKLAAEAIVSVETVRPNTNHIAAMLNTFEGAGAGVLPDRGPVYIRPRGEEP